jgi:peptidoglycan/LPS O-acetylase OafA/YrhL
MTKATSEHFRGFDGIRAIAILLVVLWHGASETRFPMPALGPLVPVVTMGWAGVDLFFALSGFLITSLLLREERRNLAATGHAHFSLKHFYIRRALRILPVFYVVFLLNTFLLSDYLPSVDGRHVLESRSPLGLWPYATFWGNYFFAYHPYFGSGAVYPGAGYGVLWSLCVEEHFYLLWPSFLAMVKTLRTRVLVAVALCLLMAAGRFIAQATQTGHMENIPQLSHERMDSILWGALGALLVDRIPAQTTIRRLLLLLLAGVTWLLVARGDLSALSRPSPFGISVGLTLLALIATVVLVELVQVPRSLLVRILDWAPIAWVGRLSYAMYLVHFQAIDLGRALLFQKPRAPTLLNFVLTQTVFVLLSIACAAVLHILVERPFLRLKDKFGTRRMPRSISRAAEASTSGRGQ